MEENKETSTTVKEKKFYKKWWFWVCIVVIVCVIGSIILESSNEKEITNNDTNAKINNSINNLKENYNNSKLKENPYKVVNDYDGTYQFELTGDNGAGHMFTSKGVISFDNGICKIKYYITRDTETYNNNREYQGFCGLNENDNSIFYVTLNDDANYTVKDFKCTPNEKNLYCEFIECSDFSGNYSVKNFELLYMSNSTGTTTLNTQFKEEQQKLKEAEEKAQKEQEEKDFKASCKSYTYEQMARNPDNFKGTNVKLTGEVIQTLYGNGSVDLRVNITKTGTYSTYYTDTIYVVYYPEEGEDKILEDDIITLYGTSMGDYSYTSTIGSQVTLPLIYAKYVAINQ